MTPEIRSDGDSRENIAITIYHNDRALIRESRRLPLQAGLNRVALRDVSARIQPETASLSGRDASLRLLEQNFDYDLLSAESLLEQYIGKHITTKPRPYSPTTAASSCNTPTASKPAGPLTSASPLPTSPPACATGQR